MKRTHHTYHKNHKRDKKQNHQPKHLSFLEVVRAHGGYSGILEKLKI